MALTVSWAENPPLHYCLSPRFRSENDHPLCGCLRRSIRLTHSGLPSIRLRFDGTSLTLLLLDRLGGIFKLLINLMETDKEDNKFQFQIGSSPGFAKKEPGY